MPFADILQCSILGSQSSASAERESVLRHIQIQNSTNKGGQGNISFARVNATNENVPRRSTSPETTDMSSRRSTEKIPQKMTKRSSGSMGSTEVKSAEK